MPRLLQVPLGNKFSRYISKEKQYTPAILVQQLEKKGYEVLASSMYRSTVKSLNKKVSFLGGSAPVVGHFLYLNSAYSSQNLLDERLRVQNHVKWSPLRQSRCLKTTDCICDIQLGSKCPCLTQLGEPLAGYRPETCMYIFLMSSKATLQ